MTDLTDIIARLEKANGPDRELDRDIWLAVGGTIEARAWAPGHHFDVWTDWNGVRIQRPDDSHWVLLTGSLDAALTLLLDEHHHWKCGYSKHVPHNAEVHDLMHPHKGVFVGEHDHSRAIALCIAALKARNAAP